MQRRKRRERKVRPGDHVLIVQDCRQKPPVVLEKIAVYEGLFDPRSGQRFKGSRAGNQGNPRFRFKDGSVIFGFECFWTTLANARIVFTNLGRLGDLIRIREEHRDGPGWDEIIDRLEKRAASVY